MKKRCAIAIAALALVAAAAACASDSDDSAITSPDASTTEAPATSPTTTTPPTAVADTTTPATTAPAVPSAVVFSFADHDLCEWLSPDRIAELVAAQYEWDGTATELASTNLPDGCAWELSGIIPVVDGLNTVSIGSATGGPPEEPFVDYDDVDGDTLDLGVGVRGHPALSEGVIYTVGAFGYVAFGVPEHGYTNVYLWVPGDEGTDDAHFAFANSVIQELGWTP